jgi:hypothetical protein
MFNERNGAFGRMGIGRGDQNTRINCSSVIIFGLKSLWAGLGTEPVPQRLESASATVQFDNPCRGWDLMTAIPHLTLPARKNFRQCYFWTQGRFELERGFLMTDSEFLSSNIKPTFSRQSAHRLLLIVQSRPPLWFSGQNFWLQIRRSWFDSQRYQIFCKVLCLERGQLSLMSTTEELRERKNSSSGL